MGKPYGHQYFFAGSGNQTGTMVCKACGNPILSHEQDWMSYKEDFKDEGGWSDWRFVCFHRGCFTKQAEWEKREAEARAEIAAHAAKMTALRKVAIEIGETDPISFASLAAEALGEPDLDQHYFDRFGSC